MVGAACDIDFIAQSHALLALGNFGDAGLGYGDSGRHWREEEEIR